MTFQTSEEALHILSALAQNMTKAQCSLARVAKIKISPETPRLVAAAMLRVALRDELDLRPKIKSENSYDEIFGELGIEDSHLSESTTIEEKWARVAHHYLTMRIAAHTKWGLTAGDLVVLENKKSAEVSSIGKDGRVYFKGGEGFGAWPDRIKKVVRRNESSVRAKRLKKAANNDASRRLKPRLWSQARASEISEWQITRPLLESQVHSFANVVENAADERAIQKFIEDNPEILASLVGGNERYCIPQKRFGDRFVPDFLLGSVDSLGIRWYLVELETPRSGIYLKRGDALDKYARKGSEQVIEWRKWVSDNLSYARSRKSEGGLGLFDIEAHAPAFVIVGRRERLPDTRSESIRLEQRNRSNAEIHTYDWLLEKLHGTLSYSGLPALSPHLLASVAN